MARWQPCDVAEIDRLHVGEDLKKETERAERQATRAEEGNIGAGRDFGIVVHNAMAYLDGEQAKAKAEQLEARGMRKSNAQVTLLILVERKDGGPTRFLMDITASNTLNEMKSLIKRRCGLRAKRFLLLWLDPGGATVELDSEVVFKRFVQTMWCQQPWTLHVRDVEKAVV